MIEMRRAQRSFGDGLITAEVEDLREDWMAQADRVLADEALVAAVYEALGQRHPKSKSRGRQGTPAEVVLRLLASCLAEAGLGGSNGGIVGMSATHVQPHLVVGDVEAGQNLIPQF